MPRLNFVYLPFILTFIFTVYTYLWYLLLYLPFILTFCTYLYTYLILSDSYIVFSIILVLIIILTFYYLPLCTHLFRYLPPYACSLKYYL